MWNVARHHRNVCHRCTSLERPIHTNLPLAMGKPMGLVCNFTFAEVRMFLQKQSEEEPHHDGDSS